MEYFIRENVFWTDGLEIHPSHWDEDRFVLHGFWLPSKQPQMRHLLQRRDRYSKIREDVIAIQYSTNCPRRDRYRMLNSRIASGSAGWIHSILKESSETQSIHTNSLAGGSTHQNYLILKKLVTRWIDTQQACRSCSRKHLTDPLSTQQWSETRSSAS